MKSFRQFLLESIDYPGAYYDKDGEFVTHITNAEQKKKYDDENPNHEYEYISDKRMKKEHAAKSFASGFHSTITSPLVASAATTALGDGVLGELPQDYIDKHIERLEEEIERLESEIERLHDEIKEEEDEEARKNLEEIYKRKQNKKKELNDTLKKMKWKRSQDAQK